MPAAGPALLEARGIGKRYGATVALDVCDLVVSDGTVHGLLGKNGAGKSTMVGIVAGSVRPDAGTIGFGGADITQLSRTERRQAGIHLLDQHSELAADLTVAENLLLPAYPSRFGLISWARLYRDAAEALEAYEVPFGPRERTGDLSVSDQRRLAIVKTLVGGGRLILLDEPTAALTRSERASLFGWVRRLNQRGKTFLFISHFISEIRELCQEYTVLRDGAVVDAGRSPGALPAAELSKRVVGADVREFRRSARAGGGGEPLLALDGFTPAGGQPLTLSVAPGEIVGFVGLPGSGATSAARALAGLHPATGGTVRLAGRLVEVGDVAAASAQGIAYLTHDRLGEGVVPDLSVAESAVLGRWPVRRAGTLDTPSMRRTFEAVRARLSVQAAGPGQPISELSGGNQQKVLLGRLLEARPKVLVLDEPTHGIDVGVKEEVHRLIDDFTSAGDAAIVLAYDVDELLRLVDRAVVFRDGAVVAVLAGERLTADDILSAMEGMEGMEGARSS